MEAFASVRQEWDNNPSRLRSLLELLTVYAHHFVEIGRMVEEYRRAAALLPSYAQPDKNQLAKFIEMLDDLRNLCVRLRLSVSATSLNKTIHEFSTTVPNNSLAQQRMNEWFSCFTSELESRLFLFVLPHRVAYWHAERTAEQDVFFGEEINSLLIALDEGSFTDAFTDATEAGLCFAYARFTACVYHLMRVAEFGLVSVARAIQVPEEKINKGWDGCIQGIESAIKNISGTKPIADWQEQIKKYSDLCSWFTTIKNGWRNPISHIPRTYSEDGARGMFSAVKTLFDHLQRQGFRQTQMPRESLLPPGDSPEYHGNA